MPARTTVIFFMVSILLEILSLLIQIRDEIGHLVCSEPGPGHIFRLHALQHLRTVAPQRCHHCDGREAALAPAEAGRAACGVIMAARALLAAKNLLPVGRVA